MKPFFEQRDNDKKITCFNATENFPAHFHSGIEIAYTLSGVTVTSVGGKVCSAEKNSLVFFDSGEVHSIIECGRYITLIIPEKYLADRLIQIEYIKRKSHELAQIPWQTYHPRNLYNYNQKDLISELIGTANSLRRKAKELITNRFMTMRNWEIQYLGKDNESHLREAIFNDKGIAPKEVSEEFLKYFCIF